MTPTEQRLDDLIAQQRCPAMSRWAQETAYWRGQGQVREKWARSCDCAALKTRREQRG